MAKMRKLICLMLAAMMVSFIASACGSSQETGTTQASSQSQAAESAEATSAAASQAADGEFQYPTTPVKFTAMWMYDWFTPPPAKWGDDIISKYIKDRFNVEMDQIGPGGDPDKKLNVMLVSNDLPDVVIMDRNSSWKKLCQMDKLVALDDYIAKYPAYKTKIDADTMNLYRQNGKIYGLLNWAMSKNHPMGQGGYVINTKIYKELGSPPLNTLDDLYNYLMLVKQKNITVDGKSVIPFQGDPEGSPLDKFIIYTSFGEGRNLQLNPHYMYENAQGNLEFFLKDPKWVETMLFLNRCWNNDLINKDVFIEKVDQVTEKLSSGRVAVYTSGSNLVDPVATARQSWKDVDPDGDYQVIEPPAANGINQKDVWTSSYSLLGWNIISITKNAKDPERIYAYFDWIISNEGQLITFNGPKGGIWDELDENGYPIFKQSRYELSTDEQNKYGFETYTLPGHADFVDFAKVAGDNRLPPEKRDWVIQAQSNNTWLHAKEVTEADDLSPLTSSKEGILDEKMKQMIDPYIVKIVSAKNEQECRALIDEVTKKAYDAGFKTLEDYKTKIWHENKIKLGKQ